MEKIQYFVKKGLRVNRSLHNLRVPNGMER
jgi:hypothetical protein